MHTLSDTLLSAPQKASRTPAISIQAKNLASGVVKLKWQRLYTGSEPDGSHAAAIPADFSLVRLRLDPLNGNLYYQRLTSPGPGAAFSEWTYLNQYDIRGLAVCSLGAEVSYFYARANGRIERKCSLDNGLSWPVTDCPDWAPSGNIAQMAAAYKPNGDLALFYTDSYNLYVVRRVSGAWQSREDWGFSTGLLTGAAAVYADNDWKLLVSGLDNNGNAVIWSLVYGDGGEVPPGNWSGLKELASAPAGSGYTYGQLFLAKPDSYRCFFSEVFAGPEASHRIYWSHTLPDTPFLENRWKEPQPFNFESGCGLDLKISGGYAWLEHPAGIWQADLSEKTLDLSPDLLGADEVNESYQERRGSLIFSLNNDRGQYSLLEDWVPDVLERGCRIDFSPGYRTAAGRETGPLRSYTLEEIKSIHMNGSARVVLTALGGWETLAKWTARRQFRWNQPDQYGEPVQQASVKEILAQVLARCGLKLAVISQSAEVTGSYPDFTIHAGYSGREVVDRLLDFVPDVIFFEGDTAYLLHPQPEDGPVYSYGWKGSSPFHPVWESSLSTRSFLFNHIRVEGRTHVPYNPSAEVPLAAECFRWEDIQRQGDLPLALEDLNINTVEAAYRRGETILRQQEMDSLTVLMMVPVNCGQQLYDVVEVTDPAAGLVEAGCRVMGITLRYHPEIGKYEQRLTLGGV